jgi:hypothetical protein
MESGHKLLPFGSVFGTCRRDANSIKTARCGKPLYPSGWMRGDFGKATHAAGLTGIRFHDLRHTAATHLRRLGRDLQVVQQLLGHKSIRMTLRYSHVHPLELKGAVNQLGDQLLPQRTPSRFTITSQSSHSDGLGEAAVSNHFSFSYDVGRNQGARQSKRPTVLHRQIQQKLPRRICLHSARQNRTLNAESSDQDLARDTGPSKAMNPLRCARKIGHDFSAVWPRESGRRRSRFREERDQRSGVIPITVPG